MTQPSPATASLVLNTAAGAAAGAGDRLRTALAHAGFTIHEPDGTTLPDRIRTALHGDCTTLLVAGGDGTIACASQILADTDTVLGIVALGTMNLLANDLGLPVGDVDEAARVLAEAQPRLIDIGRIGTHVFACACMLGKPTVIARHRETARKQGGPCAWLRVLGAALRAIDHARPPRLTIRVGQARWSGRTPALTITVNPIDDAAGRAFGRTVLDGGELCAYVVCRRGVIDQLRVLVRLLARSSRDSALLRFCGTAIEVSSTRPALRVLVDGEERLLPTPLRFTLHPRALRVLAPAAPA